MTLVRYNPFRATVGRDNPFHQVVQSFFESDEEQARTWSPTVDIFERGEELVLRAELPDVRQEDLDLKVEGKVLTLHGEKRRDDSVKDEHYHRIERSYGSFTRRFSLPSTVETANIQATYKNGVLEVVLPKAEAAKPKQIEVKIA